MPLNALTLNNIPDTPDVYVVSDVYGAVPASIDTLSAVYMFGFSATSTNYNPTFIQSPEDFFNVYGASASTNSVKLFFRQKSGFGLTFVNVPPRKVNTIAIATVTAGTAYTVTIDGYPATITAVTGDTPTTVIGKLRALINGTLSHIARMTGAAVRTRTATTVVAGTGLTATVTNAAAYPVAQDVIDHLFTTLNVDMKSGAIIAPEFYQAFTQSAERLNLYNGCEEAVAILNWFHYADCGADVATSTTGAGAINLALVEKAAYASPKGHSYYYFPYWVDSSENLVPQSAAIAGLYLRRAKEQGIQQPPAGTEFPVYGVNRLSIPVDSQIQQQLYPFGINCARILSRGRGAVSYGARSCSSNPFYRNFTTRAVLNSLIHTIRPLLDTLVFSTISGSTGGKMVTAKSTVVDVAQSFFDGGALYGDTPTEAYLVVCDATNNSKTLLQSGGLAVDLAVKPAAMTERVILRVTNTSLNTDFAELIVSSDTEETQDPAAKTTTPASTTPKAS